MSVNKEYQIVKLMRVALSIIFGLVVLFMVIKFLWDSEGDSVTKFSAFFTAISSLGILATIGVYFQQKNDNKIKNINSLNAIKTIISDECRRIYWIINQIESCFDHIKNSHDEICDINLSDDNYEYISVSSKISSEAYLIAITNIYANNQANEELMPYGCKIPMLNKREVSRHLYPSAILDICLYNDVNSVMIVIKELEHILDYIIRFNEVSEDGNADGCIDYAKRELYDLLNNTRVLYLNFTGKPLLDRNWLIR